MSLYTVGHPIDPELRKAEWEQALPIVIGNNVWIGGNVVILGGVTIGDNTVIGAGSVVTKDIPANCVAVGNPCKVQRMISPQDREDYYNVLNQTGMIDFWTWDFWQQHSLWFMFASAFLSATLYPVIQKSCLLHYSPLCNLISKGFSLMMYCGYSIWQYWETV